MCKFVYHLISLILHTSYYTTLFSQVHPFNEEDPPIFSWIALGNRTVAPEKLSNYDLILLSSEKYILTFAFQEGQQQLYAYFDLEELIDRKESDFLLSIASLIEKSIPKILYKRITGLYIYHTDYGVSREQLALLLKAIRYHYPYIKLMLPYETDHIEEFAPMIDALLFFSFYEMKKSDKKAIIERLKQKNKRLLFLSTEYAEGEKAQHRIAEEAKEFPVIPCIIPKGDTHLP